MKYYKVVALIQNHHHVSCISPPKTPIAPAVWIAATIDSALGTVSSRLEALGANSLHNSAALAPISQSKEFFLREQISFFNLNHNLYILCMF